MDISCGTTACPDLSLPEALNFVARAGFHGIELFRAQTGSAPEFQDASLKTVRKWIESSGLELTGLNIRDLTGRKADTDERNPTYNLHQIEWDMHLGHALGLKAVNLKGGARTGEALEDLIAGLTQMLERVPHLFINIGCRKGSCLENLADCRTVFQEVGERAKVLLDTGDLIASGQDTMQFAEAFGERIGLVHLRDQQGETPVPFGEGELPFTDLFRFLSRVGYRGHLVVELQDARWDEPLNAATSAGRYVEDVLGSLAS